MHHRYESAGVPSFILFSPSNHILVFSAPKYCDMTENKGAFINIGPDYKHKFTKFNAVPHPDIRPMVSYSFVPFQDPS